MTAKTNAQYDSLDNPVSILNVIFHHTLQRHTNNGSLDSEAV